MSNFSLILESIKARALQKRINKVFCEICLDRSFFVAFLDVLIFIYLEDNKYSYRITNLYPYMGEVTSLRKENDELKKQLQLSTSLNYIAVSVDLTCSRIYLYFYSYVV